MNSNNSLAAPQILPPPWTLFGLEPMRALLEYLSMRRMNRTGLPSGDGHPVIIFPGLAADGRSVASLNEFCQQLGYASCDWGLGFNTGPRGEVDAWVDELAEHVGELFPRKQSVSLIGWSLGGIYAREVAKKLRGRVRRVITIGTPFGGSGDQTNAAWLYRLLNGRRPVVDDDLMKRLRTAPDVPTTSIFSRSDGVVAWQACIQEPAAAQAENIEVKGSHCGLVWNPAVLSIIADRLRQPVTGWQRHERSLAAS